jgi:hypothetical protein
MRVILPLLFLAACTAEPMTAADLRAVVASIVPADAPRALPVALGDAAELPVAAVPSYTYAFGARTASTAPHLDHWAAGHATYYGYRTPHQDRSLPYYRDAGCYAGEQWQCTWTLNVGKAPGPWPRPAYVLVTSRPNYDAVRANDPKVNPPEVSGVRLGFWPTMAFECGNSGGIVEHDASGRVVLRWTPPHAFIGSVWFITLLWAEPDRLMVSRSIEFGVGAR